MTKLLQNRTWRELRATARALNWRFDNDFRKEEAREALCRALLHKGLLKRVLHRLSPEEHEALMVLKTHGNRLVRWQFSRAYGKIRRYRPWRVDAPLHPWRRPISLAEKLWFLGLIEVDVHRAILLPDAVADLLPPIPQPEKTMWQPPADDHAGVDVVRDVAVLLGTLLYAPVRPLHGCWLPPYTLKAINQRLLQPEDLDGVRSEFQCQRLRFLHYLAQATGLISQQGGVLVPTVKAWTWLSLPYKEACAQLLRAIREDLHARHPLWQQFKLPDVPAAVWDDLLALPPGAYELATLIQAQRLCMLDATIGETVTAVFSGPLTWLGLGKIDTDTVQVHALADVETHRATLHHHPAALTIVLPPVPPLRPLVELMAVATVDGNSLRLDASSIARAYQSGQATDHLAQVIVALTGAPLDEPVIHLLEQWTRAATRVQFRQVMLMEVATPEEMQYIRADWRLRPLLGRQLSPLHVEVRDAKKLRQRLSRRGYPVPPLDDDPIPRKNDTDPAYLWLALRVCQALGKRLPLPLTFPGEAARQFEPQLGGRRDALQGLVDRCLEQIDAKLKGQLQGAPVVKQLTPERIRTMVSQAVTHGGSLRIRYYSPAAGYETERTIEPQVIYERDQATYIEAWCYRDDAPRTFRLDRILAVV